MTIHTGSRVSTQDGEDPKLIYHGWVTAETVVELATGARVFHVVWDDGDESDEIPADIAEISND